MRIRQIEAANFNRSELTMLREFRATHGDLVRDMGQNDVILFVSLQGNQLIFVHNFRNTGDGLTVVDSRRLRLMSGEWDPSLLSDYARSVQLNIEGVELFQTFYTQLRVQSDRRRLGLSIETPKNKKKKNRGAKKTHVNVNVKYSIR